MESALENFIKSITDVINLGNLSNLGNLYVFYYIKGKNIEMQFGVCKISIIEKNLKYVYDEDFVRKLNDPKYEKKLKKSELPTSTIWKRDSKQTEFIKKS